MRKIIYSKYTLVFLTAVLLFMVYSTLKIYLRSREAASINDMVEKEMAEMEAKKSDLSASVRRLESAEGQEEEMRKRFSVQKAGEKIVIIVEEERKAASPPQPTENLFQKIWQFFQKIRNSF